MTKMKNLLFGGAAILVLAPLSANAESGPYVSLQGGLNLLQDSDVTVDNPIYEEASFETGFSLGAAAGYTYDLTQGRSQGFKVRPEVEVSYRYNSLESLGYAGPTFSGSSANDVSGDVSQWNGMANVWFDYQIGNVTPYVGGGIGLSRVSVNDVRDDFINRDIVDDSETVFAYQIGLGAAYSLTSNVAMTLDYRFYNTQDPELTDEGGADLEVENQSHTTMIGLRYSF